MRLYFLSEVSSVMSAENTTLSQILFIRHRM